MMLKTLYGFANIVFFYLLGLGIQHVTSLPIPGAVFGMVMLFLALRFFPNNLVSATFTASHRLISLMALLLLPPSVGVFFLPESFNDQLPTIFIVIVLSTALSMVFTLLLMSLLLKKYPTDPHD